MHQVLIYLLRESRPLVPDETIKEMLQWDEPRWQKYAEECKGMIVSNPQMVSCTIKKGPVGVCELNIIIFWTWLFLTFLLMSSLGGGDNWTCWWCFWRVILLCA